MSNWLRQSCARSVLHGFHSTRQIRFATATDSSCHVLLAKLVALHKSLLSSYVTLCGLLPHNRRTWVGRVPHFPKLRSKPQWDCATGQTKMNSATQQVIECNCHVPRPPPFFWSSHSECLMFSGRLSSPPPSIRKAIFPTGNRHTQYHIDITNSN